MELAIRVVPKQGLAYGWQGAVLEEPEAGLECVVDVDLAVGSNNGDTARAVGVGMLVSPFQVLVTGISYLSSDTGFSS